MRFEHQRNVVAAVMSTAEQMKRLGAWTRPGASWWIGFSEDDDDESPDREYVAASRPFCRRVEDNAFHLASLHDGVLREESWFAPMKNGLVTSLVAAAILVAIASCAPVKKPPAQVRAAAAGSRFDQIGRVMLYAGEPCASQIMFDFHGAGSTVLLGAPMRQTKILTDAAKQRRRVHVSGRWQRGGRSNCSYVEVMSVEVTK